MPKLLRKVAKEVAKSASNGVREVLPDGPYELALTSCKVSPKEGPSGPYWIAEFSIPKGSDHAGRKFWTNLSLSEGARWKMAEFFTALGNPECDAATEDLIGTHCVGVIGQETQKQGAGMGQLRNVLQSLRLLDAGDDDDEDSDDDDEDDDEEDDEDDV